MEGQKSIRRGGEGPHDRGWGPFVTHRRLHLGSGRYLVANSRRHRKGLAPHQAASAREADRPPPSHAGAFLHFWAPKRLAWWVAILFAIGSTLFSVGGIASTWPRSVPASLTNPAVLNWIFIIGALFFTSAAWLQWLEAINGDVANALKDVDRPHWRWFGWRPRNLGYLASTVQLAGTMMFNFNTVDATFGHLSWQGKDLLVWTPNMLGCACFLVASYLAYVEVSQGGASFAPRSVSWWVAVVNLLGSVAFQISALYSFASPVRSTDEAFAASHYTALGGLFFFLGSYLMIPELFDEEEQEDASTLV